MWSVFFVFLSYLDGEFVKADFLSNSLEAEKESKEFFYLLNNTLCAKRSNVGEYHLFQLSDGIEEVRSVHDATGKLVDCALTTDPMQVKSFMYMCKLGLRGQVTVSTALNPSCMNITDVKLKCLHLKSKTSADAASEVPSNEIRERGKAEGKGNPSLLRRSKRGFTYPGTLWCGAGNNAEHYDQVGEFAETDKCCRVHDHCPHVIHAFSSNYGYTNFKWHSISHCDCDNAMKACLRKVNDTSSRVVGQAFFNVIEVPCFELSYEEQCVERHWYGVCKRYDKVPVAVLKESIPYDFGGIDVIDELPLPPLGKSQEPDAEPAETTEGASTTQSTTSSSSQTTTPEAPSLTNMVTAAEDFIKVLATVSTSQGSSPDAAKEETQGSEKKRKKNAGGKKRKNKKRRGRGRGRKRRPNVETVVKTDEGAVGAPSCHVPEEITSRTNIIEDPSRSKEVDNFMRSEADLEIKEELSNSMMRDDPQGPAGATSTSAPAETVKAARQRDEVSESESALSPTTTPSPTVYLGITKTKTHRERVRLGQKRLRHKLRAVTPSSSTLKPPHEATQETPSVTTSVTEGGKSITVEQLQAEAAGQPSSGTLGNASEEGPVATTAGAPTTNPLQAKRLRSKERGGRKRAGKVKATFQREESHQTDSGEEPTVVTPVLSASEVSMLGYHVFPKRLDYLSVARRARPTISKPIEPSRKGKRRRSKESRERRKSSHILGATFTPTATLAPISTHTTSVQYSDKADYERMVTASASVTVVPPPSDTSSLAQFRSAIHDTSTQETLLFPLTGIPPGGTQKPKRKRQGRREMKKQKKVLSVLSGA